MNYVPTLEELSVALGFSLFLVIFCLIVVAYCLDEVFKLRKRCDKSDKRINLLYKYIQSYVPDGMYVTPGQFLDMHPDFDYFDE